MDGAAQLERVRHFLGLGKVPPKVAKPVRVGVLGASNVRSLQKRIRFTSTVTSTALHGACHEALVNSGQRSGKMWAGHPLQCEVVCCSLLRA